MSTTFESWILFNYFGESGSTPPICSICLEKINNNAFAAMHPYSYGHLHPLHASCYLSLAENAQSPLIECPSCRHKFIFIHPTQIRFDLTRRFVSFLGAYGIMGNGLYHGVKELLAERVNGPIMAIKGGIIGAIKGTVIGSIVSLSAVAFTIFSMYSIAKIKQKNNGRLIASIATAGIIATISGIAYANLLASTTSKIFASSVILGSSIGLLS